MKVATVKEAWELANRLFPTDYVHDEYGSNNAGYPIYMSTQEGSNAHISDLNTRLELNYDDGRSENIWIEEKEAKGAVAVVGMWVDKKVFGEVTVKDVKEVTYQCVLGMVNKTLEDGRFGIELSLAGGEIASFGCESVAYIRFDK